MLRHNCDNATPLVPVIDIVINQGADFDIQFELLEESTTTTTSDTTTDGSQNDDNYIPIDISTYKFFASIKASAEDTTVIAQMHQVDVDPKNGIVNLSLSADETSAIDTGGNTYREWEELYWDVNMYDGHDVTRICNGRAFVSPGISQGGNQ